MKLLCQGGNPLYTRTYRHSRESRVGRETPRKKKKKEKKLISGKKYGKEQKTPFLILKKTQQKKILLFLKNEIYSNNIPTPSFMAASQLIN